MTCSGNEHFMVNDHKTDVLTFLIPNIEINAGRLEMTMQSDAHNNMALQFSTNENGVMVGSLFSLKSPTLVDNPNS